MSTTAPTDRVPQAGPAESNLSTPPLLLRAPRVVSQDAATWQPIVIRPFRVDTIHVLVVFLALQFLIPSRLVIGGLGAVGRPSVAIGILLAFLWFLTAIRSRRLARGSQPVRWLLLSYFAVQLIGYAVGYDRLMPDVEASAADRYLIYITSMVGMALAVTDGILTRRHLDQLLRALVVLAAGMAFVGALQFFSIIDLTRYIQIPGLSANSELIGIGARGSGGAFNRVAGTATHYIEFGAVLALVLPLAIHYALFPRSRRDRYVQWVLVALIASSIPFSISRSAIVTVAVALAVLVVVWPWRHRYNALVIGVVCLAAFHVVNRGVLGTIKSLFTNMDNDPSIENRLNDVAYVTEMWAERPWLGRGTGTLLPSRYILLDNQFYGTLLTGGILGIIALALIFVMTYAIARSVRLRAPDQESRHLGQALAGIAAGAMVASGTFDALAFPTFTGVLFMVVGAAGALWRLTGTTPVTPMQVAQPGDTYVSTPLTADMRGRIQQGIAWSRNRQARLTTDRSTAHSRRTRE